MPAAAAGLRDTRPPIVLIIVAPELAVELLASGAIYECRQLHWIQ